MSVRALEQVLKFSRARSASQQLVALIIANYAKDDGTGAFPSHKTIARDGRMSLATVKRAITDLTELGELTVVSSGGGRRSARYVLTLHNPVQSDTGFKLNPLNSTPGALEPGQKRPNGARHPAHIEPSGGAYSTPSVVSMTPDPSLEPSTEPSRSGAAAAARPATQGLLAEFDDLHRHTFGHSIERVDEAADAAILAGLCREHGTPAVRATMGSFFEMRDRLLNTRGYSVAMFAFMFHRLAAPCDLAAVATG